MTPFFLFLRIVDEFFCADVNAADPAVICASESEGAASGRPDGDTCEIEECGEAGNGDVGSGVRQSTTPSQSEDGPDSHQGTQIDANVDSQVTTVDDSQSSGEDITSGVSKPALDFNTVFRSF